MYYSIERKRKVELTQEILKIQGLKEYQELASRTAVKDRSLKEALLEVGLGCSGEAGEISDEIKKIYFHDHEINRDNLIKEAGDVLWYIARLASVLDTSLEEIAERNIEKLRNRYPNGFTTENSIHRSEENE